jgi:hypothetical protein
VLACVRGRLLTSLELVAIRRGGLELLLENSTKLHKVEVNPMEGDSKVLLPRSLCFSKATLPLLDASAVFFFCR